MPCEDNSGAPNAALLLIAVGSVVFLPGLIAPAGGVEALARRNTELFGCLRERHAIRALARPQGGAPREGDGDGADCGTVERAAAQDSGSASEACGLE